MMKPVPIAIGAALAVAGVAWARTEPSPDRVLAGRVAGPPVQCLSSIERDRRSQIFDDGSVVFSGRGRTVYLNRIANCPFLKSDRALLNDTVGDRLCSGDIVQVIDPPGPIPLGSCALGAFVPYERPAR